MPTIKENLIAAKALIDTPEKWLKGEFGFAGCFCTAGALREVCGEWIDTPEWDALYSVLPAPFKTPVHMNDHPDTTHADVMALFDRAIAAQDGAA